MFHKFGEAWNNRTTEQHDLLENSQKKPCWGQQIQLGHHATRWPRKIHWDEWLVALNASWSSARWMWRGLRPAKKPTSCNLKPTQGTFKASYHEVEIGSMSSIRVFLLVEHLIWCKSKCLLTLMVLYEINKPSPVWPIYRFSFLRLDPSFPEEALTILWGFLRQRWIDYIIFSWGVYKD